MASTVSTIRRVPTHLVPALKAAMSSLPMAAKFVVYVMLLVNIRSFPMSWHVRVFWPLLVLRARWYLLCLKVAFKSKQAKQLAKQKWLDSITPIGQNPFDLSVTYKGWAAPDDCDFNMHLSNSSYPKILDSARLKSALKVCPTFFRAGGWMALGATHHHFIREIPMFASYEARLSIGSWDNKWFYSVIRFVTLPKSKSASRSIANSTPSISNGHAVHSPLAGPALPDIHIPPTPLESGADTPAAAPAPANLDLKRLAAIPEPDGATLHCLAVSALCFKVGRITVPPAIVLASEGFSCPPPASANGDVKLGPGSNIAVYSRENPPPHWAHVREMVPDPYQTRKLRKFLAGGWKDVPEGQRWWQDALGGPIEEVRQARIPHFDGLRLGMEGARYSQ